MSNPNFAEWVEKLREKYQTYVSIDITYDAFKNVFNEDNPIKIEYQLYMRDRGIYVFDDVKCLKLRVKELLND